MKNDFPAPSSAAKRITRAALSLLACGGVTLALWPAAQSGYAHWQQNQLQQKWQRAAAQPISTATISNHKNAKSSTRKVRATRKTPIAELPPTRILIPEIGLDAVLVQGQSEDDLKRGPGHDIYSALPGQKGNCVIAAHRNVYGSYFYRVDELLPGSKIILRTPHQKFTYSVVQMFNSADTDSSIKNPPADPNAPPMLTLYTCTLPISTTRIIITAQLAPADAP